MRPRDRAVTVHVHHHGAFLVDVVRTPYDIYIDGARCSFVRFDHLWHLLEAGDRIELCAPAFTDFQEHPRRFW